MNLLSLSFSLFYLAVLVLYYVIPTRYRRLCLLAASLVFYLCSDLRSFLFLLASIATTCAAARLMEGQPQQRKKLVLAAEAAAKYYSYNEYALSPVCSRSPWP